MLTAAIIIYIIISFLIGPIWPLELISGKAGIIGRIIAFSWIMLLISGMKN
jgi:hypothetical protein